MIAFTLAVIASRKGTRLHKTMGKVWMITMIIVAVSSFFINEIRHLGPFSAIHLLSVAALVEIYRSLRAVRTGNIAKHKSIMSALIVFAVFTAGFFTFLPGRLMPQIFFNWT